MTIQATSASKLLRDADETASRIIETDRLTRDFKKTRAVDNLDLRIERNELFGLVGPDGAGKTTLLRLLAGLLKISAGSARVAGHDLGQAPEAVKPNIGYMAQRFSLYAQLTVLENLNFFADLYDVTAEEREARTERLLAFAGLTPYTARRAEHLSGGMRKKLALACTLIHDPPILLLDEPTTGVDPVSRREFWSILTDLYSEGATIVVSTPYMDEADRCSRVALMYEGRFIRCAPPDEIRADIAGELIELVAEDWQGARRVVTGLPGVLEVQTYGTALHFFVDSAASRLNEIAARLGQEGIAYHTLRRTQPRMEEAFISLMRRHGRERMD
jgi:ABC-2 type transport system ATP-binding protein